MLRIGVFGGSFDPPHLGHFMVCLWALEMGEVDRVVMVPVGQHAFGKKASASLPHRLEMCQRLVQRFSDFVDVSAVEDREGMSYMIDTLNLLKVEYPDSEFRMIAGTDVADQIHDWKEGKKVLKLAPILRVPRLLPDERGSDKPGALPPISSSDVRELLKNGEDVSNLIPPIVRVYIQQHRLYQAERKVLS